MKKKTRFLLILLSFIAINVININAQTDYNSAIPNGSRIDSVIENATVQNQDSVRFTKAKLDSLQLGDKTASEVDSSIKNGLNYFDNLNYIDLRWFGFKSTNTASENSTAIETACTYARVNGGTLFIAKADTFLVEHRIIINWDGGGIIANKGAVLKRSSTFDINWDYDASPQQGGAIILLDSVSNGIVKGLTVNADYKITDGDEGCGNPILVQHSNSVDVVDCKSLNITGHTYAIWIRDCSNIEVNRCEVSGDADNIYSPDTTQNFQEGIEVSQGNLFNITIENCYVHDIGGGGLYNYVDTDNKNSKHIKFINNYIYNVNRACKVLNNYNTDSWVTDVLFYGNSIIKCDTAIYFYEGALTYSNYGYRIQNIFFEHNFIDSCNYVSDISYIKYLYIRNKNIIKNIFDYSQYGGGICLVNTNEDIEINDNDFYVDHGLAIYIGGGITRANIKRNNIYNPHYNGIFISTNKWFECLDNTILGANTADTTSDFWGSAIMVNSSGGGIIDRNYIYDSKNQMRYGIYLNVNPYDSLYLGSGNFIKGTYNDNWMIRVPTADYSLNNVKYFHGTITPANGATTTRVYTKRISFYDHILVTQIGGTDLRPYVSNSYKDGFLITHDSAVGTETFFYLVLPPFATF